MKQRLSAKMHWLFLGFLVSQVACSEGVTLGIVARDAGADASDVGDRLDADASAWGMGDAAPERDAAQEPDALEVSLRVEPIAPEPDCSEQCAHVSAVVSGEEKLELSYVWSEGSWQGPGPHRVCSDAPPLTVTVDVASARVDGEFGSEVRHGSASAELERAKECECTAANDVKDIHGPFTAPAKDVNYWVCTGSPEPIEETTAGRQPYFMRMYSGDSFSVALRAPVPPGEQFAVGYGRGTQLQMRVEAATAPCGPPTFDASDGKTVVNTSGGPITHLIVSAHPVWPFPAQDAMGVYSLSVTRLCAH